MKYLIVDDDFVCRELLEDILSPYGTCETASDGKQALQAIRTALESNSPYHLICLDIMMPGMDGHEVLGSIRKLELEHNIYGSDVAKVIMTTSLRDSKHCVTAFSQGCESYVTKPIDAEKLLGQVRHLLGELNVAETASKTSDACSKSAQSQPANLTTSIATAEPEFPSADTSSVAVQESIEEPVDEKHFLVVDDDPTCRELLGDLLCSLGQCDFAHNGQEAIEAVRLALEDEEPYDLVCLDIMMPGMDGHETLKGIREVEAKQGLQGLDRVKVIMATSMRDSKHCIRAFQEGCESYVTKPIEEERLFSQMRKLHLIS